MSHLEIAGLRVGPGTRAFTTIPVTRTLLGAELALPLHIVCGREAGPVLGLTAGIHGVEHLGVWIVRDALKALHPEALRGVVVAVPVANPLSFVRASRVTPEDDIDFGNLNRVFPGRRATPVFGGGAAHPSDRTVTEMLASTLTEQVLPHLTHLLDFHTHFNGVGLAKVIIGRELPERVRDSAWRMAKAFGMPLIQEETMRATTCTGQAAAMGVPAIAPEVGGDQLPTQVARRCVTMNVRGILGVMAALGMLPQEAKPPVRYFIFRHVPHVRPRTAGYLIPVHDPVDLFAEGRFGVEVKAGEPLGHLFDPYTLEDVEELSAPTDGILYMSRRAGPIEAGGHAFAVASYEESRVES
ncbi:MAG: succinylglutamate desuccinylase/aspartoacylase family protein [Armatimonadota bacterium]|nr:succinylglutamate desuccinylase/aspartoacylase family protein [Armatimonadota bacterium]